MGTDKEVTMWILKITQVYLEDDGWRLSVTREFRDHSLEACVERLVDVQEKLDVTSQVTLRHDGRK